MKQLKNREDILAKITITAVREVWKDIADEMENLKK